EYVHRELADKPQAEAIMQLPAVVINVSGSMSLCNLSDVLPKFDSFLSSANNDLKTDDDFANGEATAKFSRATAKTLKLKAKEVIDQISTVSEAVRTLDLYAEKFDALGLKLEKAVTNQKEAIKSDILNKAKLAFTDHIAALESEIKPIRMTYASPDFAGSMKGKRNLSSLHDAVDSTLANAKIATDAAAKDIRTKLAWCKTNAESYGFLFMDMQQIIHKANDDFQLIVTTRIADHKRQEEEKAEARRKQIQEEERDKAEKAAQKTIEQFIEQAPISKPIATTSPLARISNTRTIGSHCHQTPEPADLVEDEKPSDLQIVEALANEFDVPTSTALKWILGVNLDLEQLEMETVKKHNEKHDERRRELINS
ncbi:MAG: hypothetical protein NWQ13_09955, partial [Glaciimonas sp.]|nr:hypothetical protein [Glaciimonas sp.]